MINARVDRDLSQWRLIGVAERRGADGQGPAGLRREQRAADVKIEVDIRVLRLNRQVGQRGRGHCEQVGQRTLGVNTQTFADAVHTERARKLHVSPLSDTQPNGCRG